MLASSNVRSSPTRMDLVLSVKPSALATSVYIAAGMFEKKKTPSSLEDVVRPANETVAPEIPFPTLLVASITLPVTLYPIEYSIYNLKK